MGMGMILCKILDQYLYATNPSQGLGNNEGLKTLTQNFNICGGQHNTYAGGSTIAPSVQHR